jgi:hypothetical protein
LDESPVAATLSATLEAMQNTHEVAQSVAPEAKVVYVDNDPLVLAHARALLTSTTDEGVTTYINADFNVPELIISDARNVLNFKQPVAVMFMGVLGHAPTDSDAYVTLCRNYTGTGGVPYTPRPAEQLERAFDGMDLVSPGFVPITQWHVDSIDGGAPQSISAFGGLARKL